MHHVTATQASIMTKEVPLVADANELLNGGVNVA
jgi:hypothetical protein